MTIIIFDPAIGTGTLGTAVPAATKRKFTKCTAYNPTGAVVSIKISLVPSGGSAANSVYVDYDLSPRETYNCPEVVGAALGPGGTVSVTGAAVIFSAVASDSVNN